MTTVSAHDAAVLTAPPAALAAEWARQGVLVFDGLWSAAKCAALRQQAAALWAARRKVPTVAFETDAQSHADSEHFVRSGGEIRAFTEADDPSQPNKLGHALHDLDPVFAAASRDRRLAALCRVLGMSDPRLVQSMYIFKNPQVGGAVNVHQDAAFLRTDPPSVIGLWVALHDAHRGNGGLWVLPGCHREAQPRARFGDDTGTLDLHTDDERPWPLDRAVPLEVKAGSLVVLHGLLPHFSHPNRSAQPREAYALHVVDGAARWHAHNWLRRSTPFSGFDPPAR